MGLLKKKPQISLRAPLAVPLGRAFELRARLDCPEPLRVDGLEIEVVATLVYYTQSQYGRHRNTNDLFRARAQIELPSELDAGEHTYPARFELPVGAPGSYRGKWLAVEYSARVRVDIPWWPDAKTHFALHVPGHVPTQTPRPAVYATRREGPDGRKPYAEVSLATSVVSPGGELRGAVALSNVEHNRYRAVNLALVARESLPSMLFDVHHDGQLRRWKIATEAPREGARVDFRLQVPGDVAPSFEAGGAKLEWFLEVEVDVALARDPVIWIPLQVSPGHTETGERAAPLAVGADRVHVIWSHVAQHGPFELDPTTGELTRNVGATTASIRLANDGRAGTRLECTVTYPDVGIGLGVRGSGSRAQFDARDDGQRNWLVEHLSLPAALTEATDTRMLFTDDGTGRDLDHMNALAAQLAELQSKLETLHQELPSPASMLDELAAWRTAAERQAGVLDEAAVRIVANEEDTRFGVRVVWKPSAEPDHLEAFVEVRTPIDGRHHREWTRGEPAPALEVGGSLEALTDGADRLSIGTNHARVELPITTDIDAACARAVALRQRVDRLLGRGGTYR